MICTLTLCDISLAPTILFLDDRFNLSQYLSDGLEGKKLEGSLLSKILQDDRKLDPSSLFWNCLLMAKKPLSQSQVRKKVSHMGVGYSWLFAKSFLTDSGSYGVLGLNPGWP